MFSWLSGQREWCCPSLRELYEARYGRNLFVFVRPGLPTTTAPSFWLAFRVVRQCDLAQLTTGGLPPEVPLTITTSRRIFYCPGCGVELERFYVRCWEQLLDPVIIQEFELSTSSVSTKEGL